MDPENLLSYKHISVVIGAAGTVVWMRTGEDMPGGREGDPVCAIFFDPGAEDDEGEVTEAPKYLVYTDSAINAVLRHGEGSVERSKVLVHEIQADLVWLAAREMEASDADKQITGLLGMSLAEAARRRGQPQRPAAQPSPQA